MKSWQFSLIGLLAATVMLGACSKEEKPAEPVAPAAVAAPAPAPVVNEPGGYVPTEEERYHPPAADAAVPANNAATPAATEAATPVAPEAKPAATPAPAASK